MLFNSPAYTAAGGPSLYTLTSELAGDPEGAPSAIWTEQMKKNFINVQYMIVRAKLGNLDLGHTQKVAYETSVADQKNYSMPTDYVSDLEVELSTTGQNLSTASPSASDSIYLESKPTQLGLQIYNSDALSGRRLVVIVGAEYWILGAPTSTEAGTNAIRVTYRAETAQLSGDTDEPLLPVPLRPLIAYRAAIALRKSRDLPYRDLENDSLSLESLLEATSVSSLNMKSHQIPVSGLARPRPHRRTKMGQIRKIG